MLRSAILLFIIFSFNLSTAQQNWHGNYISISNVTGNAFYLQNNFDNSLKIKTYKHGKEISSHFATPGKKVRISFPVKEFTRSMFNDYEIAVYYDDECYNHDLQQLVKIAEQRYRKKVANEEAKTTFRFLADLTENFSKEGSFWNKTAKSTNAIIDVIDYAEDVKMNGFDEANAKILKKQVQDMAVLSVVENKYLRTIYKSIDNLHDFTIKEFKIYTKDLDQAAIKAFTYISSDPLKTYFLDFDKHILPVIDPDGDGVTNYYDQCDNLFGESKYDGCPRKVFVKRRRALRNANFQSLYVDFSSSIIDHGRFTSDEYPNKLSRSIGVSAKIGFPFMKRNIGSKQKGSFVLDFELHAHSVNARITEGTESLAIFSESKLNLSLSYLLLLNQHRKFSLSIQPRIGTPLLYSLATSGLKSTTTGDPVPSDLFVVTDGRPAHSGLEIRIYPTVRPVYHYSSRGNSTHITFSPRINLFGGAAIIFNPTIVENENYNFNTRIDDIPFNFPTQSLQWYGGISVYF